MNYVAVKLDIVQSRRARNRSQLQERLFAVVEEINSRHAAVIRANFVITHGDEVQGLLHHDWGELVPILERVYDWLNPHQLRVGVGMGTLHTRLQPAAIGMDGPVWHRANEAIDEAARTRRFVRFNGFGPLKDDTYSSMMNLLLWQRQRWTQAQRHVIEHIQRGATQAQVAEKMNISAAAVSKHLRRAGWRYYDDARRVLKLILRDNTPAGHSSGPYVL